MILRDAWHGPALAPGECPPATFPFLFINGRSVRYIFLPEGIAPARAITDHMRRRAQAAAKYVQRRRRIGPEDLARQQRIEQRTAAFKLHQAQQQQQLQRKLAEQKGAEEGRQTPSPPGTLYSRGPVRTEPLHRGEFASPPARPPSEEPASSRITQSGFQLSPRSAGASPPWNPSPHLYATYPTKGSDRVLPVCAPSAGPPPTLCAGEAPQLPPQLPLPPWAIPSPKLPPTLTPTPPPLSASAPPRGPSGNTPSAISPRVTERCENARTRPLQVGEAVSVGQRSGANEAMESAADGPEVRQEQHRALRDAARARRDQEASEREHIHRVLRPG